MLSVSQHLSAFAFGAGRWGVLPQAVGALLQGRARDGADSTLPTLCLAFAAESCPHSPAVPSSPLALILSEEPQPLSTEALAPALQQLDLAAPTTAQVRTMNVPQFPHPQGLEYNACFPPACQAPFAFPAELRPLQVCQGQADKLQWQDANGHGERNGSRGKHTDLAVLVRDPQWATKAAPALLPSHRHLRLLPQSRGPTGANGGGDAEAVPR